MRAYLAELARSAQTPAHACNVVREYLQARILGALQRVGAMIPLAFHGGTVLRLQHHDRASLLAGKLHAILQRPYVKGRDLYDLLWYLSDPDWPAPNLTLLNNALRQTGWTGGPLTETTWREVVRSRLQTFAWDRVVADVKPFLEPGAGLELLTRENLLRVLENSEEHSP